MSVVATAVAVGLVAAAVPATAATTTGGSTPVSQSTARIVQGSIGTTSLDTIAELAGIQAQNFGGAAVSKDVTPDLALLNKAITVPLGQLKGSLTSAIPGLSLQGLLEEKVTAKPDGSATGDASVAGLGLDLGTLTSGATNALASLKLELGAVTAHAQQAPNPNGPQSGSCSIAGLGLDLTSPLLAGLYSQLNTALSPILTTLSTQLNALLLKLNLGSLISITTYDANGTATTGLPTLSSILDKLTNISLANGAVTVNLQTGTVHIDVAALLKAALGDLCGTPNANLLQLLGNALTNQLPTLLKSTVDSAVSSVTSVLKLCPASPKVSCLDIKVGGVDISTLASSVLNPILSLLTSTVSQITTAVQPVTAAIGNLLTQLSTALAGVIDITTDKQTTSGGTFSETALELKLLSGAPAAFAATAPLLQLDLSNATVGPQSVLAPPTSSTPAPPSSSKPPIKVNAGMPGPADDGGVPLLWVGLVLLLGGVGGAALLRMKAARHS